MLGERWSFNGQGEVWHCISPDHLSCERFTEKFSDKLTVKSSSFENGKREAKAWKNFVKIYSTICKQRYLNDIPLRGLRHQQTRQQIEKTAHCYQSPFIRQRQTGNRSGFNNRNSRHSIHLTSCCCRLLFISERSEPTAKSGQRISRSEGLLRQALFNQIEFMSKTYKEIPSRIVVLESVFHKLSYNPTNAAHSSAASRACRAARIWTTRQREISSAVWARYLSAAKDCPVKPTQSHCVDSLGM